MAGSIGYSLPRSCLSFAAVISDERWRRGELHRTIAPGQLWKLRLRLRISNIELASGFRA
jgi:hypothetical protein